MKSYGNAVIHKWQRVRESNPISLSSGNESRGNYSRAVSIVRQSAPHRQNTRWLIAPKSKSEGRYALEPTLPTPATGHGPDTASGLVAVLDLGVEVALGGA